jgi:hypothetical protein
MAALKRVVGALLLFGISFGYVEAAVVVYLRQIYSPFRQQFYPAPQAAEPVPLLSIEQLQSVGPEHSRRVVTEMGREIATLVMLAAVALLVAPNVRLWLAAFLIAFGAWDIAFYAFLRLLTDWPGSLLTWDVLFLVPVPWIGPVLAPVLISCSMIIAGVIVFRRESTGSAVRLTWVHAALLGAAALLLILSFTWDFRAALEGRPPASYNWTLFAFAEALGAMGFLLAVRADRSRR